MAHSIQVFGDRSEVFNDLDLLVLMRLMSEELGSNASSYPLLVSMAARWRDCCENYSPGSIDLNLELAVAGEKARQQFASLLSTIAQKLERSGDTIPAGELNSRLCVPGVTFHDYRTTLLLAAIEKIKQLLLPVGS
ncbi:MAG TPA: hypothetical protein VF173_01300 [Thermoanaerobaculia bacterium]|nr:hypothetical protein [Thermoanaerobaculia bacterium]